LNGSGTAKDAKIAKEGEERDRGGKTVKRKRLKAKKGTKMLLS